MAVQHIKNVRIAGIAAAVPRKVGENRGSSLFPDDGEYEKFVASVGIERRRLATPGKLVGSDMGKAAADKLIEGLGWDRGEIELIIYVSQSQDYKMPATAGILQDRLGLPNTCMAFDVSLGCSGWVYGMGIAAGLVQSGFVKKALLLAGNDDISCGNDTDRSHAPLFGAAFSATALQYDPTASEIVVETGVDGSQYGAIITRDGGSRHPFCEESLQLKTDANGNVYRDMGTTMDGPAVFVFTLTRVPRAVKSMLQITGQTVDDIDYFVFHQANMLINEKVRAKCKIPEEKYPISLRDFGNNSSGSIPVAIVTQIARQLQEGDKKIIACGFGAGLSWATMSATLQSPYIPELIELDERDDV